MSGALAKGCQQWVHVCFGVKPALGLPVATGERAVAISLVNVVSVSWSGAGLGFSWWCLLWHVFCMSSRE